MPKAEIIERLGESAVLLPDLIADALAANDRIKLRLTLLQEAKAQAVRPQRQPHGFEAERRASGLDDPRFAALIPGARLIGSRLSAPGAGLLIAGAGPDLRSMLAPLQAAGAPEGKALAQRLDAILAALPKADGDELEVRDVDMMTAASRKTEDSLHPLIMDLHKAINRLAAATAVVDVDGARAHHLTEWDTARVRAFMAGLNRTAPLAFGHPGLGTLAARTGARLTIQNDIGETDAHVLVAHVEGLSVTVTYTDVHRRRARFFMALFGDRMVWTPLAEEAANGLGDDDVFYLVTGRFDGADEAALDDLLGYLGSRIVFLIDWNKARKALQVFVGREAAIDLLGWAADHGFGHRGFLELGGADLVLDTVRRAATGKVPYGVRLDGALGVAETMDFLRRALRETSEGLAAGRSARLIRDEVQADLAQRFETVQSAVLVILVRHLGLSRVLASVSTGRLADGGAGEAAGSSAILVERARRLEAKADRLTVQAREICGRLQDGKAMRALVDEIENAMDAMDECAFLLSLHDTSAGPVVEALRALADLVVESLGQMVCATEAAIMLPEGRQTDAMSALQAIDAVLRIEREADLAERTSIGALMATVATDARPLVLGLEIARSLESVTDHLAHAAFALREHVLGELSA